MPRRTNPFQNLSASIMALVHGPDYNVQESVIEKSKVGNSREIDIVITEKKHQGNKILVECRDHARPQTVEWIESLYGKQHSLGYKKVVAISSSGFTAGALAEAQSKGIKNLTLKEAEKLDWKTWLFSIQKFGIVADFESVIKKVELQCMPRVNAPSLEGVKVSDIYLINLREKKKVSLDKYIKGLVQDPKIIEHVRTNNTDNAVSHYKYEIPCDPGVGYIVQDTGKFIQLTKIIFFFDSARQAQKVPLTHMRAGLHKVMVGQVDSNSRLVLEERKGSLVVMIET